MLLMWRYIHLQLFHHVQYLLQVNGSKLSGSTEACHSCYKNIVPELLH